MLCSSYSSRSGEVREDEHVNVEEVSDPSIANQDFPLKKDASASVEPKSIQKNNGR